MISRKRNRGQRGSETIDHWLLRKFALSDQEFNRKGTRKDSKTANVAFTLELAILRLVSKELVPNDVDTFDVGLTKANL